MISLDSTNLSHLESFNKNRYRKHSNKNLGAKCYFAIFYLLRGRLLNTQNTPRTLTEYAEHSADAYWIRKLTGDWLLFPNTVSSNFPQIFESFLRRYTRNIKSSKTINLISRPHPYIKVLGVKGDQVRTKIRENEANWHCTSKYLMSTKFNSTSAFKCLAFSN